MPVALDSGSGEKKRKETDVKGCLRPAQRWAGDQKSWSPLERKARSVGDKARNVKVRKPTAEVRYAES